MVMDLKKESDIHSLCHADRPERFVVKPMGTVRQWMFEQKSRISEETVDWFGR